MPHAHHFLERLDRVPRSLVDFALSLSLQETSGPYVVVTRESSRVTARLPRARAA
jgi:hypothetical protein